MTTAMEEEWDDSSHASRNRPSSSLGYGSLSMAATKFGAEVADINTATGVGALSAARQGFTSPPDSSLTSTAVQPYPSEEADPFMQQPGLSGYTCEERGSSTQSYLGGRRVKPRLSETERACFCVKSWYFLHELAAVLKLGKVATHTALVFFHRFFQHQLFEAHDRLVVCAACVYLASKVEERGAVKLTHIVFHFLVLSGELPDGTTMAEYSRDYKQDVSSQLVRMPHLLQPHSTPHASDLLQPPGFIAVQVNLWKNRIIVYERTVLYTIGFDLNVTKPFKALGDLMRAVRDAVVAPTKDNKNEAKSFDHRTFFSQACKFLNDSMTQPAMAEAHPTYAAAMALLLTAMLYEVELPANKSWVEVLQIENEERFYTDCMNVMELYSEKDYGRLNVTVKREEPFLVNPASAWDLTSSVGPFNGLPPLAGMKF